MADHRPWLKLWKTAYGDPSLAPLSAEDMGHWVRLLLFVGLHGERGRLVLKGGLSELADVFANYPGNADPPLQQDPDRTHSEPDPNPTRTRVRPRLRGIRRVLARLPGVFTEPGPSPDPCVTVIFKNWPKYQEDDSRPRVRKHRHSRHGSNADTPLHVTPIHRYTEPAGNGARVDKNREDTPLPPQTQDGLIALVKEGPRDSPEAEPTQADEEFKDQIRRLRARFGEIGEAKQPSDKEAEHGPHPPGD